MFIHPQTMQLSNQKIVNWTIIFVILYLEVFARDLGVLDIGSKLHHLVYISINFLPIVNQTLMLTLHHDVNMVHNPMWHDVEIMNPLFMITSSIITIYIKTLIQMIVSRDIFQETSIAYHPLQRCHWTICKNVVLICNGQVINQFAICNAWFDIFFTLLFLAKTISTLSKRLSTYEL